MPTVNLNSADVPIDIVTDVSSPQTLSYSDLSRGIYTGGFLRRIQEERIDDRILYATPILQEPEEIKIAEKEVTAMDLLKAEWKYNRSMITGRTYERILEKWSIYREKRIQADYTKGKKNGGEFVSLHSPHYTYSCMPGRDMYPKEYCTEVRPGMWILNIDIVETMEGEKISRRSVGGEIYRICHDTQEITRNWRRIAFRNGEQIIHNYGDIDTIQWRGTYYEKSFAEERGLIQCDCGEYVRRGELCRCMNPDPDGYHSNTTPKYILDSDNSQYRVGLEIEKPDRMSGENHIKMKKAGWRCETDSSVGYEYITPVLPLDDVENTIEWIAKTGGRVIKNTINSSCGGHIHVSVKGESSEETYDRIQGWRPLLWALYPHRASYSYCNRKAHRTDHSVDVGERQNTVEIRIFPGLDSIRKLRFRLSLIKYMLDNPQTTTEGALEKITTDENFLNILLIAYGKNTVRLGEFFTRVTEFYGESGISGEHTAKIAEISKRMVHDKQSGQTPESIQKIRNLKTGE